MQITCRLNVVLILIFITPPPPLQSIPGDTVNAWVVRILLECNLVIYFLLIKINVSERGGTDHLYLFTYANELLIKCAFRFNIQYLFVYLFKAMSTKAGGSDHLLLFTYANDLLLHTVFILIFSIYLFIYSKQCQQKQVEATTCFYLLMEITCCYTWFSF